MNDVSHAPVESYPVRPDTTVAERELGWKAQVGLEEGLRRTVDWFRGL